MKTKSIWRMCTAVGLIVVGSNSEILAQSVDAPVETNKNAAPIKSSFSVPKFKSANGKFDFTPNFRFYADAGWVNDGKDTQNLSATEIRAARLGFGGKFGPSLKYKFSIDFAGGDAVVKDASMEWSGPFKVTVGQFKTPNSIQAQTSSRFGSFTERASFITAFSLSRKLGVGVGWRSDDWTAKFGVFRGDIEAGTKNEGVEVAGRVTHVIERSSFLAHLGASFRYRDGDDQSGFRYRQRPHNHQSARFIDTGRIADDDFMVGLEAVAVAGPLSLQGEFSWLKADVGARAPEDPTFAGGYIEASWFQGGSRNYNAGKGAFDRPNVDASVFEGGGGAWQVAARFDTIDLTEAYFLGGKQNTYLIGVNWYLNRHVRLMANYSYSDIRRAFAGAANGPDGSNDINAFGLRAQFDW